MKMKIKNWEKMAASIKLTSSMMMTAKSKTMRDRISKDYSGLLLKPIRSRIDYNFFNYCSVCNLKFSKQILRCPDCKQKVRTKPWHRSKVVKFKRI